MAKVKETLGESQRYRDLEDRLVRSEQRAFERLQQIAETCEEAQNKYAELLEKYTQLSQEHQQTLAELEAVQRLCEDQQRRTAEVSKNLVALRDKLIFNP